MRRIDGTRRVEASAAATEASLHARFNHASTPAPSDGSRSLQSFTNAINLRSQCQRFVNGPGGFKEATRHDGDFGLSPPPQPPPSPLRHPAVGGALLPPCGFRKSLCYAVKSQTSSSLGLTTLMINISKERSWSHRSPAPCCPGGCWRNCKTPENVSRLF